MEWEGKLFSREFAVTVFEFCYYWNFYIWALESRMFLEAEILSF